MPLLECKKISKRYGRTSALEDVSFALEPGTITALLGLNGAGKSTLFRILAGLVGDYTGEILWRGESANRSIGSSMETAFLFDDPRLFEDFNALGNARLFCTLNEGSSRGPSDTTRATGFLGDAARKKVREYSHGMRCRLAFGLSTLYSKCSLLILDEPTNGLDVESLERLEIELRERATTYGAAVLFSTHYLETVERIADRAILLRKGRVLCEEGSGRLSAVGLRDRLLDRGGER